MYKNTKPITKRIREPKAKNRGINGHKSISIDKLLSIIDISEPIKDKKPIRDIRKENFDASKILKDPLLNQKVKLLGT